MPFLYWVLLIKKQNIRKKGTLIIEGLRRNLGTLKGKPKDASISFVINCPSLSDVDRTAETSETLDLARFILRPEPILRIGALISGFL